MGDAAILRLSPFPLTKPSDGFHMMFPCLPAGLNDFVDKVVPLLGKPAYERDRT